LKGRKVFFSEEKKQKTFDFLCVWAAPCREASGGPASPERDAGYESRIGPASPKRDAGYALGV
jgi:hypothetical protein